MENSGKQNPKALQCLGYDGGARLVIQYSAITMAVGASFAPAHLPRNDQRSKAQTHARVESPMWSPPPIPSSDWSLDVVNGDNLSLRLEWKVDEGELYNCCVLHFGRRDVSWRTQTQTFAQAQPPF